MFLVVSQVCKKSSLLSVLPSTKSQGQGQIMPSVYMLNNICAPYHLLMQKHTVLETKHCNKAVKLYNYKSAKLKLQVENVNKKKLQYRKVDLPSHMSSIKSSYIIE